MLGAAFKMRKYLIVIILVLDLILFANTVAMAKNKQFLPEREKPGTLTTALHFERDLYDQRGLMVFFYVKNNTLYHVASLNPNSCLSTRHQENAVE